MRIPSLELDVLNKRLVEAAKFQDNYDNSTINLIAPAAPSDPRYVDNLPLKHNAITEGLLGHRPYAGAEGFNRIETIAVDVARSLFGAEHANVQPHSVSDANAAAYFAVLEPGDPVLGMRFDAGGHLTHGMSKNFSGRFYNFSYYGLKPNGHIDYDEARELAIRHRPKLIVAGASSYPRNIDFEKLADIAHESGAKLLSDVSHPAGLIVTGNFPQPFPHSDIVTFTPDKTMLGPHGGIIMCKKELAKRIDSAVHPGIQSSVPLRRIYAIAQCLIDCHRPEFNHYIGRLLENMSVFSDTFSKKSGLMVTGGSDTNLMVIDTLNTMGITGREAEAHLESLGILTNRQVIPGDRQKPYIASGIRLGSSWITARGYSNTEVKMIADAILDNLESLDDHSLQEKTISKMKGILSTRHPADVWNDI